MSSWEFCDFFFSFKMDKRPHSGLGQCMGEKGISSSPCHFSNLKFHGVCLRKGASWSPVWLFHVKERCWKMNTIKQLSPWKLISAVWVSVVILGELQTKPEGWQSTHATLLKPWKGGQYHSCIAKGTRRRMDCLKPPGLSRVLSEPQLILSGISITRSKQTKVSANDPLNLVMCVF